MDSKKVLIHGTGFFQHKLLSAVSMDRKCIVVDTEQELLNSYKNEMSNIDILKGDLTSIPTWKKLNLPMISHIILSIQDYEMLHEVLRITRDEMKLQVPVLVILYKKTENLEELDKFNVKIINPLDINIELITGIIDKNYIRPLNIGLGEGEIVEVLIIRRSHMIHRKLKHFKSSRWKVVVAYRDNQIIFPDDDFMLEIGDRIVIVGEPKAVANIVQNLTTGMYQFPLEYGSNCAVLIDDVEKKYIDEILFFESMVKSKKLVVYGSHEDLESKKEEVKSLCGGSNGGYSLELKSFKDIVNAKDVGMIVTPVKDKFNIFDLKIRYLFRYSKVPLLLTRGVLPYEEIVVSLNGSDPDRLLETSSELATFFSIKLRYIFVTRPDELMSQVDEENLQMMNDIISNFESVTNLKLKFDVLKGNPVRESLKAIDRSVSTLLMISSNSNENISLFSAHVPYYLAAKSRVSVLVLPSEY